MDADRFDSLARALGTVSSRRRTLASALGGLVTFGALPAGAKKGKGKKKRKKPKLNAFGCFNVGQPCQGNSANCCSGICQGKKPKKGKPDKSRCIAHNTGGCTEEFDGCRTLVIGCGTGGFCFRTTGNASFCGGIGIDCRPCARDTDCEAVHGPGAACVVCDDCIAMNGSSTLCYPPAA